MANVESPSVGGGGGGGGTGLACVARAKIHES